MDREKIALFIDADNAPANKISDVLAELAKLGVVNIRRAYGNWKNPNLTGWEEVLHDNAIKPIQQFDLTKGKNATDIAMVIDIMDLLHTRQFDVVCILSSDCDFTPLATRVHAEGKKVIGFGERKTPMPFVNACTSFLYLDSLEQTDRAPEKKPQNLNQDTRLIRLLRSAIVAVQDDDGWAKLGQIGQHISNHSSFDHRNYGFNKLKDLFGAISLFELKTTNCSQIWVRDKKALKMGHTQPSGKTK